MAGRVVGFRFTHCQRGHELAGDNLGLYTDPGGYTERFCKTCTRRARRAKTLRQYGWTIEEYESVLKNQEYKCALCKTTNPGGKVDAEGNKHFSVDHCHTTGKVRKLLCSMCNTALGAARDNPELLRKMAEYLEEHNDN